VNTLLHIDTAGPDALIGISQDLQVIASKQNNLSNTHGEFVQAGVEELCKEAGISLKDMDAITVTMGPGSYTGLRVGLASAKGLAFALNKPLIGLSTLSLLAKAAVGQLIETGLSALAESVIARQEKIPCGWVGGRTKKRTE
jgi:tRNA threonylcarbamoyladenosine biosynthesis protein TsaB